MSKFYVKKKRQITLGVTLLSSLGALYATPIAMPLDEVKHAEKISSVFGGTLFL
jgi:hypothetical protein